MDRHILKSLLVHHEGERLKAYKDSVGKWTIGVGRNLQDCGVSAEEKKVLCGQGNDLEKIKKPTGFYDWSKMVITHEQAMLLLNRDIDTHMMDLVKAIPWFDRLDPVRQVVLVDMAFNMGVGTVSNDGSAGAHRGLMGFTNTLRMVKEGHYATAAAAMLKSKWATQVGLLPGQRAHRLAWMMEHGTYEYPHGMPPAVKEVQH